MLYPKPIRKGDCVAILSPATEVRKEFVDGAESFLRRRGYEVAVMPSALGPAEGSFASSLKNRLNDIESALRDDSVKAILCARGGYGCVHLLQHMPLQFIREHAKWIVGFSDVSALHALWQSAGVASVHGPMAKHLATEGDDDPCSELLMQILEGARNMRLLRPLLHITGAAREKVFCEEETSLSLTGWHPLPMILWI